MNRRDRPLLLVVDDTKDNLDLMRDIFDGEPYDLVTASSGHEALDVVHDCRPDVIVLDIIMPDIDGIEVCRKLKEDEETECIPVIMTSALGQDDSVIRGLDAGAQDYVSRPFSTKVIQARVRSAVRIKTAHDTIVRMNKRLEELYATAQEFVENVSHEFRTPLTVIKEFASIIRDGLLGEVNEEQNEYLDVIRNRVDDLAIMVEDMLDISRLEAGILRLRRMECRVEDIYERVKTTLERKAAAGKVTLDVDIDPDLPAVYCDPEKIGRVIVNLAVNAVKFSNEGGHVWMRIRLADEPQCVLIEVVDNGPGINPDSVTKIFDRFKQLSGNVRSSTKGFGLGLNIARELVHLCLGDIYVESELQKGSKFSFTVPISDSTALIARYLDRLDSLQEGSRQASLVVCEVTPSGACTLANDVELFLQHQVKQSDIVFPLSCGRWLLAIGGDAEEAAASMSRWDFAREESNRNRPQDPLPPLKAEACGSWNTDECRAEFLAAFRGILAESEAVHV